jgi:cell division protein FtsL
MGRIINAVLLMAMIVGVVVTYNMKHQAELAAAAVARLQAEVTAEKQAIALLKAEWSMLTQPGRLQTVIERHNDYFKLAPFSPDQLATVEEIEIKPIQYDKDASEILARLAASEIEPLR